jgi:HK97 gp10 family phage protein
MAKIKINGLNELKKELKKLGEKKAKNIMVSGLRAGAVEISKTAKANAPDDTGVLRKSIGVTKRKTPKGFIKFSVSPRENVVFRAKGIKGVVDGRYAINVEYGTQHQQAQPFMRNTFDQLGQNVTDAISRKIAKRIEKESNVKV